MTMKKINSILMAAALMAGSLTSCVNDSVEETTAATPQLSGQEIRFNAGMGGSLTRATAETTTDNLTSFQVYAFSGATAYISNVPFGKSGSSFAASEGTYYWPAAGGLDVFAWSPASAITPSASSASQTFAYNISDWKSAVDLIVADKANKTSESSNLTFNHMLSQISFQAKMATSANYDVTLTKVTLKNIKPELSYSYTSSRTLTAQGTAKDYEVNCGSIDLETTAKDVKEGTNLLMLVPQELNGTISGSSITGTYVAASIVVKKNGVTLFTGDVNLPLKSSDSGYEDWEAGKRYAYTIEFGDESGSTEGIGYTSTGAVQRLGGITLTATVSPWTDGTGGDLKF